MLETISQRYRDTRSICARLGQSVSKQSFILPDHDFVKPFSRTSLYIHPGHRTKTNSNKDSSPNCSMTSGAKVIAKTCWTYRQMASKWSQNAPKMISNSLRNGTRNMHVPPEHRLLNTYWFWKPHQTRLLWSSLTRVKYAFQWTVTNVVCHLKLQVPAKWMILSSKCRFWIYHWASSHYRFFRDSDRNPDHVC